VCSVLLVVAMEMHNSSKEQYSVHRDTKCELRGAEHPALSLAHILSLHIIVLSDSGDFAICFLQEQSGCCKLRACRGCKVVSAVLIQADRTRAALSKVYFRSSKATFVPLI
jgi:hypothetical protein